MSADLLVGRFAGWPITAAAVVQLVVNLSFRENIYLITSPKTSITKTKPDTRYLAFKLVWCPTESFDIFVLVDDDGEELAQGKPTGRLPSLRERQVNYKIVAGSKYAVAANQIAKGQTTSTE